MDEIIKFIKTYTEIAAPILALVSGMVGWFANNLLQYFLDFQKYKKEIKTFFWKEKINAGKKASEYYLEYMNFLNLASSQFEMFELGMIENHLLIYNIQNEVKFYSDKLKSFPHFEFHHINIFYEFEESKSIEITNSINKNLRNITELKIEESDSKTEIDRKVEETREYFKNLKLDYSQLFSIYKEYLKTVRLDIKKYI